MLEISWNIGRIWVTAVLMGESHAGRSWNLCAVWLREREISLRFVIKLDEVLDRC